MHAGIYYEPGSFKLKNLIGNIKLLKILKDIILITIFPKYNDGKNILRKVMNKYIPNNITNAKKQGFSSPDASWFKGESIEFVRKRLICKNSPLYEILDRDSIIEIVENHFSGKENKRLFIWSMLNLDEWISSHNF